MNILYIPLTGYLAQWAINRFGNPMRFPARSYEHALLATHITKRPHNIAPITPITACPDLVPIVVPTIHGRDWCTYNYLPRRGYTKLIESLEWLFRMDIWSSMVGSIGSSHFSEDLDEWRKSRGISLEHLYALDKKLYRMRKDYEKSNRIILGKVYSKNRNINNIKNKIKNTD